MYIWDYHFKMKPVVRHLQILFSLLAFISVFIISSLWGELAVLLTFIFLALLSSRRKHIFLFFLKLFTLVIITLLVHLFFRFGENAYWQSFSSWALWDKALFFSTRNANILFIMSYLIKSGPAISLSSIITFLERIGPAKLVQPITLAIRYTSLIRDEFQSLQQVHRIMGIRRPKRLIAYFGYYTSLVLPTIISSLERAEHLSIAMTSRGYNQETL